MEDNVTPVVPTSAIEEMVTYMSVPSHRFAPFRRALPGSWEGIWQAARVGDISNLPPLEDMSALGSESLPLKTMTCIFSRGEIMQAIASEPWIRSVVEDGKRIEDETWQYTIRRIEILAKSAGKSLRLPPSVDLFRIEEIQVDEFGKVVTSNSQLVGRGKQSGFFFVRVNGNSPSTFVASWIRTLLETRVKNIKAELSAGFSLQYEWTASIGYAGCGSVLLPTNPMLLASLFETRDVARGRKRRDAILHWVGDHFRRHPYDEGALIEVRKHLRGNHVFNWDGFEVIVKPSLHELSTIAGKPSKKVAQLLAI